MLELAHSRKSNNYMDKIGKVMKEFKAGALHSGSKAGKIVGSRAQALAIAMSEAGKSLKKKKDTIGTLPGTNVPYRNDRQRLNQY